ncbi:MAG TPA: helix-turn-helix domain-containing protein [Chthoniobacterales bacterium]|jgi:cytoskeleton protein RodZ
MEPLGQKLKQARLARKITLEEASRVTKIRPARIQEIEDEDFSSFAGLAYAKGFLLIYGKFLDVDVTPYLDAFETSDRMTVEGYSYLQDGSPTTPLPIVRRQPTRRPGLVPFLIAIAVLVIGLYVVKIFLDIQRISPPHENALATPAAGATVSPMPPAVTPTSTGIVAPRAVPVQGTPASEAGVMPPRPTPRPATPTPTSTPNATEPEVRRAEPVHPEDLPANSAAPSPNEAVAAAPVAANRIQIIPLRKTFVTVTVNGADHPTFAGWLSPTDAPLVYQAQQVTVKALERGAIEVTKNGAAVAEGDKAVTVE